MTQSDDRLPLPNPAVAFRPLEEGGLLVSGAPDICFGVNSVGARIWSLMPPECETLDDLCRQLAEEYTDVSIEQIQVDVASFVRDLLEAGLVIRAGRSDDSGPPETPGDTGSSL